MEVFEYLPKHRMLHFCKLLFFRISTRYTEALHSYSAMQVIGRTSFSSISTFTQFYFSVKKASNLIAVVPLKL